jgi:hypothetical protein
MMHIDAYVHLSAVSAVGWIALHILHISPLGDVRMCMQPSTEGLA